MLSQYWETAGNVVASGNFLGSTNAANVDFKTNNVLHMRLSNIDATHRSNLLIGGTVGQYDADGNAASIKLKVDIQEPVATTYGANVGLRSITSANGTNGVVTAEGWLSASASWGAQGIAYGAAGNARISKLIAAQGNSAGLGGTFSAILGTTGPVVPATLSTTGNYKQTVAGVNATLSGSFNLTGTGSTIAALVANDVINNANTWGAHITGKAYVSGSLFVASDRRFKKDVRTFNSALATVNRLRGVQYEYRQGEFADRGFQAGKTDGFIAQELREVLPELVHEGSDGFLSVNYQGVIPVLTEAVKELKAEKDQQISEMEARLAEKDRQISTLEARLAKLEAAFDRTAAPALEAQDLRMSNQPNPFSGLTTVQCSIPATVRTAELIVLDMTGREITRQIVSERGQTSVEVNLQTAPSGTYIGTLVADGKPAGTLKLVVSSK